ncbi:MAG: MotA/TolQ/ExbB proton channel family protein [Acidobacteriota bacterium]|nr:MotA/TolQ/ExbB proton channel family protein [Acidobacteriota bacterium]
MALICGFVASLAFLYLVRFGIGFWAKSFYHSADNNVALQVIEDELHFDASDSPEDWPEVVKQFTTRQKEQSNDQLDLFRLYRQAFCKDDTDLKLLEEGENKDLDKLFVLLASKRNGPSGYIEGLRQLSGKTEGFDKHLKEYLENEYLIAVAGWRMRPPDAKAVLRGMGKSFGPQNDSNGPWGLDNLQKALNMKLNDEDIGPVYEKVLLAHLERMGEAMAPFYRALQLVFGIIQLLTLTLFFTGLFLLRFRYALLQSEKSWPSFWMHRLATEPVIGQGWGLLALKLVRRLRSDPALEANLNPDSALKKIKDHINRIEERLDKTEYAVIDYIIWGMPSLGFVGTVLGIGAALGDADKVVSAMDAAAQAGAISGVTSLLGVAFDTTLVALICGLPAMALMYWIRSSESSFLNHLPEQLEERIFKPEASTNG